MSRSPSCCASWGQRPSVRELLLCVFASSRCLLTDAAGLPCGGLLSRSPERRFRNGVSRLEVAATMFHVGVMPEKQGSHPRPRRVADGEGATVIWYQSLVRHRSSFQLHDIHVSKLATTVKMTDFAKFHNGQGVELDRAISVYQTS